MTVLISVVVPVYNIDDLKKTIDDYDEIAKRVMAKVVIINSLIRN